MFHYLHGGDHNWCYLQVDLFPNVLLLAGSNLNPLNVARYRLVLEHRHRWGQQCLGRQCGTACENLPCWTSHSSHQSHSPDPSHPYRQTLQAGEAGTEKGRGRWKEGEIWGCQEADGRNERKEEISQENNKLWTDLKRDSLSSCTSSASSPS
jgi:hypothetical protein